MSSPAALPRSRVVCRIARQWAAWRGETPAHAATCPECREYFHSLEVLDHRLRRGACEAQPVMSTGFERRILSAVRASTREAAAVEPPRLWLPVAAGAVAVAVVAVALISSNRTVRPGAGGSALEVTRADAAVLVGAVQTFSDRFVGSVLPSTGEFVANNPLQQEAESLYADARSAVGFLAMNFLPARRENPRPPSG